MSENSGNSFHPISAYPISKKILEQIKKDLKAHLVGVAALEWVVLDTPRSDSEPLKCCGYLCGCKLDREGK